MYQRPLSTSRRRHQHAIAATLKPTQAEKTDEDPLARLKRRTATKSSSGGRRRGKKKPTDSGEKAGKKPTVWRDGSQRNKKATAAEVAALDRSGAHGDAAAQQAAQDRHLEEMRGTYLATDGEKAAWDEEEELLLEDESDDEARQSWYEKAPCIFRRGAPLSLLSMRARSWRMALTNLVERRATGSSAAMPFLVRLICAMRSASERLNLRNNWSQLPCANLASSSMTQT